MFSLLIVQRKKSQRIALLVHGYNSALCDTVENFKVVGKLGVQASYSVFSSILINMVIVFFLIEVRNNVVQIIL